MGRGRHRTVRGTPPPSPCQKQSCCNLTAADLPGASPAPSSRDSTIPAGYALAIKGRTHGQNCTDRGPRFSAGLVSWRILVVVLMSFPSRHCIRHGGQPGCSWLDDTELAVPPTRWLPRLAKSPRPVAGWRGQTKTPTPKAVATFIHRQQALVAGDQRPRGLWFFRKKSRRPQRRRSGKRRDKPAGSRE